MFCGVKNYALLCSDLECFFVIIPIFIIMAEFEDDLTFNDLSNIESVCAILGLSFPDTANEFQKSALTLAHLMASLRDYVLKGHEIPRELVELADKLSCIMVSNELKQR